MCRLPRRLVEPHAGDVTSHVVPTREAPPGTGNPRHARRARRARRHIALMLMATFVSWVGQRLGAIALPLVQTLLGFAGHGFAPADPYGDSRGDAACDRVSLV